MYAVFHKELDSTRIGKIKNGEKIDFPYPCALQYECSPYSITLSAGIYFLEVYGAQGGTVQHGSYKGVGGYGGHSTGVYRSLKPFTLYLHVGGRSDTTKKASYNGGGGGYSIYDGNGGGATDFRLGSGSWDQNLDSRLIIAGGGGGGFASKAEYIDFNGGNGGEYKGGFPECTSDSYKSHVRTQSGSSEGINSNQGKLAVGAGNYYGSGGGGFYGGGNAFECGGGGGSGFIGNVTSFGLFKAITDYSNNEGPGNASITLISLIFNCQTQRKSISLHYFLIFTIVMIK